MTDGRRKFVMQRSTAKRDKAILLTLLDTVQAATRCFTLRADRDRSQHFCAGAAHDTVLDYGVSSDQIQARAIQYHAMIKCDIC